MQKTILLAFFALIFGAMQSQAQAQKISECKVKYTITTKDVKDAQTAMLEGSRFSASFKELNTRIQGDFMGGLMGVDMVMNETNKSGLVLLDMLASKKAIPLTASNYKDIAGKAGSAQGATTTMTKETKKIAGYTCKKGYIKAADGTRSTVYICEQIQVKNMTAMTPLFGNVKGFPLGLEYTLPKSQGGGKVEIYATSVSIDKIDDQFFKLDIPAGYEVTTIEELQKMGGN